MVAPEAMVEMPEVAPAVAAAEAEIPEFAPEAEIEATSEIDLPAERELTPV